ncbi:heterokaryon incompatibility protein-domain-containing protein [Rhypophila decipiens]|uniref:Heterokaryon incompatibility protein-domain-containing protein n=1 Tax=Rhypophila decipiens TaxID=261697 RepID=A0AAN6YAQ8_9PEZI|nr:heterokaryon incompatibility protein-domain-containing protein [Rhypophila decipiens]
MSKLCSICNKIQFKKLTCPTASDLQKAHSMQKNGIKYYTFLPFEDSVSVQKRVKPESEETGMDLLELGPLGRIRARAEQCGLCSLFYNAIKRRGALYANNRPIPENDDNVVIMANLHYYAYINESLTGATSTGSELFWLRRLYLFVTVTRDTEIDGILRPSEENIGAYHNIAQPCHITDFIQDTPEPRLLFSGRKRPDTIDIALLKRWIRICQTEHDMSCEYDEDDPRVKLDQSPVSLIRFIDVERNCIAVEQNILLHKTDYLALSYCWGRDQQVKLDFTNSELFYRKGSLPDNLPRTIQDSILLTRLLGFRYLWVDVLCIFQGPNYADERDRKVQLSNMGNIYREANVTIVAACGPTADAGLNGLLPGSRTFKQEVVQVIDPEEDPVHGGLALVSTCSLAPPWTVKDQNHESKDGDLELSAWNKRAWTFQERALARRCLIFTPEQVYWSCDGGIFCEESHFEPPDLYQRGVFDLPLHINIFSPMNILGMKTLDGPLALDTTTRRSLWIKFQMAVDAYSRRLLTCLGDVHDAFGGLLEAFTAISDETFHWGHPRSRFELSLLWNSPAFSYRLKRRMAKTTLPMTKLGQNVILPSWSWMGWLGPVRVQVEDERLETEVPEIVCFEHDISPLQITRIQGRNKYDCNNDDLDFKKPTKAKPLPPWKKSHADKLTLEIVRKHLPTLTDPYLNTTPPGHILFFWSSSVTLRVQKPPDYSLGTDIIGSQGNATAELRGIVTLPPSPDKQIGTVDTMSREYWEQTAPKPSGLQEFIAVGRRVVTDIPGFPPVVLALQIRWDEEGKVAERVNFGEIDEASWMEAGPVWKLIALM